VPDDDELLSGDFARERDGPIGGAGIYEQDSIDVIDDAAHGARDLTFSVVRDGDADEHS
jgi:hypothetical protein